MMAWACCWARHLTSCCNIHNGKTVVAQRTCCTVRNEVWRRWQLAARLFKKSTQNVVLIHLCAAQHRLHHICKTICFMRSLASVFGRRWRSIFHCVISDNSCGSAALNPVAWHVQYPCCCQWFFTCETDGAHMQFALNRTGHQSFTSAILWGQSGFR